MPPLRGFGLFGIWFYKYVAPTALKKSERRQELFRAGQEGKDKIVWLRNQIGCIGAIMESP